MMTRLSILIAALATIAGTARAADQVQFMRDVNMNSNTVVRVKLPTDGMDAANKAYVDAAGLINLARIFTLGGAETTFDFTNGMVQVKELNLATTTLVFANGSAGGVYTVILKQDATGGRMVTWPVSSAWPGGVKPVLTSTANAIDIFTFVCDGAKYRNIGCAADSK